jgi:hypothetical protein
MKLFENSDEIIIRHVPVKKWIVGTILTFIFGIFIFWLIYYVFVSSRDFILALLETLPILFIAAAVAWILFKVETVHAPLITVIVNQKAGSVSVIHQRFYGKKETRYYFYQIQKFKSYKSKANFSPMYFLALILANQKTFELNIPVGSDKQNTIKLVKKLNKFIKYKRLSKERADGESV